MNKQIINKINKARCKSKKTKVTKVDIMKELKPKLKIINRFFRLEKLKEQEKIAEFQDGFIDPTMKPTFVFLRSELKSNKVFRPSTNISSSKRNKTFSTLYKKGLSLNGFKNYSGKKNKTELLTPHNYDDLQFLIDLKEAKNDLIINRYLLKKELNRKKKKTKNTISRNPEKNKIKLKIKNEALTKSILLTNNNVTNSNILDSYNKNNNNKIKRPYTSKGERNNTPKLITNKSLNECKNNTNSNNNNNNNRNNRIIKSATTERTKKPRTQREYKNNNINIINLRYPITNRSNNNLSCYTTTFGSFSKSCSKNAKNSKLFKKIEKKVLNMESFFITKRIKTPLPTEKSEFKSTKQIIKRIMNDCNIIDRFIRNKEKVGDENHSFNKKNIKKNKEDILLELSDRLKLNKLSMLKSNVKNKEKRVILEDEKAFEEKLAKIPNVAKKFFRDVYKRILFEKRVLNKVDKKNIIESIEEKEEKKKLNEDIKKEVKQRMILTKDNYITDKDDKKLIDEQKKLFDFYGNIEGLEWLITKKHVLNLEENGPFNRRYYHK